MKKICVCFGVTLTTLFWFGCSKSDAVEESSSFLLDSKIKASLHEENLEETPLSVEEVKDIVAELGYDISDLKEYADYYTLGTDLIFFKSTLEAYRRLPQPRLNVSQKLNPEWQRLYLKVYYYDSGDADHLANAVKAWNEIDKCNINFSTSSDSNPDTSRKQVEVWIQYQPSGLTDLLRVEPPVIPGTAGLKMMINVNHEIWGKLPSDQKKYLIMHGLGHIIGLKDYNGSEPFSDGSIMLSESKLKENQNLWSGFSMFDIRDLRQMYPPLWNPQMSYDIQPKATGVDADRVSIEKNYVVTTNYTNPALTNPTYEYSITKLDAHVECQYNKQGTNAVKLWFSAPGACKLTTKIMQNGEEKGSYDRIFYAVASKFESPSAVALHTFYDFKWTYWDPECENPNYTFEVSEAYFDNHTDRSVTIENVKNGHIRIRFNDNGQYTVRTKVVWQGKELAKKTFVFTKLSNLSTSLSCQSTSAGSYKLPEYPNGPTGFHPLQTEIWNVKFGNGAPLDGRLICYVHKYAHQQALNNRRRIDRSTVDRGSTTFRIAKGAPAVYELPPIYKMYDPDYDNYAFHYKLLWEYYAGVSYPNERNGVTVY